LAAVRTYAEYRSLRRFPALDGLRAISITLVLFEHSRNTNISFYSGGINGVVLFFVLSGFLITSLSLREESRTGRLHLRKFAIRRFFRIIPLYYAALACYCVLVIGAHLGGRVGGFEHALPYYAGFFQEYVRFGPHPAGVPFFPFEVSWSLGIEEKFYLLWPLVAFFLLHKAPSWRIPVAGALTVLCGLAPIWLGHSGLFVFYYGALFSGCLMAFLLHDPATYERLRWLGTPLGLSAAIVVAIGCHVLTFAQPHVSPDIGTVIGALLFPGFALLVGALVVTQQRHARVLDQLPLVKVGVASYAIYLLHLIAVNAAETAVPRTWGAVGDFAACLLALAAAIAICLPIQRFFESPITNYGHRLADRLFPPPLPPKTAVQQLAAAER
jgi:peptidoglycan/LPS O-acetylase OafA/YrhL